MAVIEIQAATLPGFPYYFPYRTGVRAFNAATVDGSKVYYGDTDVTLTASAEVTSLRETYAEADLGLTGTTTPDSLRNALVDTDQSELFAVALDFLRESRLSATETITALRTAIISRGQQLESMLELTAWLDHLAQINAAAACIDPVVEVTVTADIQLNAAGVAEVPLVIGTTAGVQFAALLDSSVTVTATPDFTADSYIAIEVDDVAITVNITADLHRSVEMATDLAVTATPDSEGSRKQFIEADQTVDVSLTAKVTNADAKLVLTAATEADIALTRYLDAELVTTATTLVDFLDTRYGDAAITVTAGLTAGATLAAFSTADLDLSAAVNADSLRTVYAEASQEILADIPVIISHEQPFIADLELVGHLPTSVQADFVVHAPLAVTATETATVHRDTYAAAQYVITADTTAVPYRTTYAQATVEAVIAPAQFPFMSLGAPISPIPYAISAGTGGFMHGDYVGNSHLGLLGSSYPYPNAYFLAAAVLRAMVDPTTAGVMSMKIDARLDTTAVIDLLDAHRTVWAVANEMQVQAILQEYVMHFIWLVQAELNVLAHNPAAVLYRHSGGNPMWLMYFYAGEGRRTL